MPSRSPQPLARRGMDGDSSCQSNGISMTRIDAQELRNVAVGLKRVYPLPDDGEFSDLLARLKRATQRPRMVR